MEHNHFATLADGTVITYSDIQERTDGTEYITIHFETPGRPDGPRSMDIEHPGGVPQHVVGYSRADADRMVSHYRRIGDVLLMDAREERMEREQGERI
jgi:hypothetical protein